MASIFISMDQFLASLVGAVSSPFFRNVAFLVGVLVAVISIMSARRVAQRKQTADALFATRNDKELQKGLATIKGLHESSDNNIRAYAKPDKKDDEKAKEIRYVLNHFEYVSIGIQNHIYDEVMYKQASFNTIARVYQEAKPFIECVREVMGRPTLYQEFEWLAERWLIAPLALKNKAKKK